MKSISSFNLLAGIVILGAACFGPLSSARAVEGEAPAASDQTFDPAKLPERIRKRMEELERRAEKVPDVRVAPASWRTLLSKLSSCHKKQAAGDGRFFEWQHSLSQLHTQDDFNQSAPDSGTHDADYATARGAVDDRCRFLPRWIDFVSERWTIEGDKTWRIEQWLFRADMSGKLRSASKYVILKRDRTSVVKSDMVDLSGEAESVRSKFETLMEDWKDLRFPERCPEAERPSPKELPAACQPPNPKPDEV